MGFFKIDLLCLVWMQRYIAGQKVWVQTTKGSSIGDKQLKAIVAYNVILLSFYHINNNIKFYLAKFVQLFKKTHLVLKFNPCLIKLYHYHFKGTDPFFYQFWVLLIYIFFWWKSILRYLGNVSQNIRGLRVPWVLVGLIYIYIYMGANIYIYI